MTEVELRMLVPEDASGLFALVDHNRAELTKFWWEAGTQSVEDSQRFITAVNEAERTNGAPTRGIFVNEALIGVGALHTIDWQRKSSLMGYWTGKEWWGKGYGSQIVHGLASLAFEGLGLSSLHVSTRESNLGSRRVAEKNGFVLQKIDEQPLWLVHDDKPVVTAHYRLTVEDYFAHETRNVKEENHG